MFARVAVLVVQQLGKRPNATLMKVQQFVSRRCLRDRDGADETAEYARARRDKNHFGPDIIPSTPRTMHLEECFRSCSIPSP